MNNLIHCFTFSIEDIASLKDLVTDYRKLAFVQSYYPQINDVPFRVTFKAKELYNGSVANPDCVLTFRSYRDGTYNFHYETANSVLLNVEGIQKPFDYSVKMNRHDNSGKRYDLIKKPDHWSMEFLKSNYKFGVKTPNIDVFMLGCQLAQFCIGVVPCILNRKEVGDRIYYSLIPNYIEEGKKYIEHAQTQQRKSDLLNGWDTVTLTEKQYYKIVDTNEQNGIEYNDINIPLPKFCLALFDGKKTDYCFFEKKGNTIKCGIADPDTFMVAWFNIIIGKNDGGNVHAYLDTTNISEPLNEWLQQKADDESDENWAWCGNAFFAINTFMLHFADVTMEVETKEAIAPSEPSDRKSKNRTNTVRLFKTYKLIKGWKGKARKKAEITCLAWGVRGHIRHYRNGKTVFIEPYVKGKDRAQYKGKEYALLPYKDA